MALITDNLRASVKTIVADHLRRWSIEMLTKDEQHLRLGDYRVIRPGDSARREARMY